MENEVETRECIGNVIGGYIRVLLYIYLYVSFTDALTSVGRIPKRL